MKISELEKLILESASKLNLNRGKEILKRGDLIKINISKIDDYYNIYGSFKYKNKIQSCNSHLKIDLRAKKIVLSKCECDIFLEVDSKKTIYLCEHLAATSLYFIQQIKKKLNKANKNKEIIRKDKNILKDLHKLDIFNENKPGNSSEFSGSDLKEKLELNISLKEVVEENGNYFDVNLFVGLSNMYPITNIQEFIDSIIKLKDYYIGKGLIYKDEKYYFSNRDKKILEYIYEYILISKDNNIINAIRIHKDILKRFLENLVAKKIKFNYNYQTYICEVKDEDLPISFTLKQVKEDYVLTTKKFFPAPLNERMDVFFFNRKIYIPSSEQTSIYKVFYKLFKQDKQIIFYKDIHIEDLYNLISHLYNMSKDLSLDDAIIEKLGNNTGVEFNFEKQGDSFYCNVILIYNENKLSYCEALTSKNEIIRKSKKLRRIESELNKNRFFYKNDTFIFYGTDDDFYTFLKEEFKYIKELGKVSISESSNKYYKLYKGDISEVYLDENEDNSFDFSFKLDGIDNKELGYIVEAYKNKKSYIKLKGNTFVDLEDKELIEFIRIIDSLNIDVTQYKDEYKLQLNQMYYLYNKLEKKQINSTNERENLKKSLKRLDEINGGDFKVPGNLKCSLREYQVKGYNWFKTLSHLGFGGILADEMGLGKTIQTIAFLLSEKNKHSLIVTPTSLIYNWKQEIDKIAPDLKVGIIHGSRNERIKVLSTINDYDAILTTYGTLKNDISEYEGSNFDYLIVDEGQNINNPESQNAKVIKNINSKIRFVLTGTPIENNLIELWALFDFIMPGYLYTKQEFSYKFINKVEYIEDLKILISPYILRRTKNDVIQELPEKIESKYLVEMTESQKKVYKACIKDIQNNIKNQSINKNNITIFSYLTKLRQICLDPTVIMDDYTGGSGKINIAKDLILKNMKEHKILLFSQFTSVLTRISHELRLLNIEYCYLDGSIPSKDRIKLVDEFNNNTNISVFLISLKAGGTGLNLTSADIVIHFDPWWNLSAEDQATDRAHRIGQKKVVEVIKLIAKDTIEENILLLQDDKKELINEVITGELKNENIVSKLKSDEILNLFFK